MLTKEAIDTLIAQGNRSPVIDTPDGGKAVQLPPGYTLGQIAPLEKPLTHTKQHLWLHDCESLVRYLNEFKLPTSRIFAEPGFLAVGKKARVVAVVDYHKADGPQRGSHVASYEPRYSEAWLRWHKACEQPLSQREFAELIEECRADIAEPDAATLIDVVRTFKGSKAVEYDSVDYQRDGTIKLHYSENVAKTGSSAALPEVMKLGIPVYYAGAPYSVPLFVRFRIGGGGVAFMLKLDRADRIEEAAFTELVEAVRTETDVPAHIGRLGS